MELSELFYSNLVITSSTILLAILGFLYRSKCTRVYFCGIEIERDTQVEEEIDMELQEQKNNHE